MSQNTFSISLIVLVMVICTFMSTRAFGEGCLTRTDKGKGPTVDCLRWTSKEKCPATVDDIVNFEDLKELDTMVDRHNELYGDEPGRANSVNNSVSLGWFEAKRKHIQCTNCVIVRYYLKRLQWIVDGLIRGDHADSQLFARDLIGMKNHVVQMLSLLYAVKCSDIQHWLWSVFFKISAVQSWSDSKRLVIDHLESYTDLDMVLSRFVTLCLARYYLPVDTPFDYSMPLTNTNSYTVRETVFKPLYDNRVFYKYRKYLGWFTVENLYLTGLWGKEEALFVGNVPGISLDWRPVLARLAELRASVRRFYTENLWVHDPYRCVGYHSLIAELIDVRLYSYVCVHLQVYINLQAATDEDNNNYWRYNVEFHQQLANAFKCSQIGDIAAQKTLDRLHGITLRYIATYAESFLTEVALRIHMILGLAPPTTSGSFAANIFNINPEDVSVETLKRNITGLTEFTATLNTELDPVDFNLLLIFMRASAQDDDKFFAR